VPELRRGKPQHTAFGGDHEGKRVGPISRGAIWGIHRVQRGGLGAMSGAEGGGGGSNWQHRLNRRVKEREQSKKGCAARRGSASEIPVELSIEKRKRKEGPYQL